MITVQLLGEEFTMAKGLGSLGFATDPDQLEGTSDVIDKIKLRVHQLECIPPFYQKVTNLGNDVFKIELRGSNRITTDLDVAFDSIFEVMPTAREFFKRNIHTRTMNLDLDSEAWGHEELHVRQYVALRQWLFENGRRIGDIANMAGNTHGVGNMGTGSMGSTETTYGIGDTDGMRSMGHMDHMDKPFKVRHTVACDDDGEDDPSQVQGPSPTGDGGDDYSPWLEVLSKEELIQEMWRQISFVKNTEKKWFLGKVMGQLEKHII